MSSPNNLLLFQSILRRTATIRGGGSAPVAASEAVSRLLWHSQSQQQQQQKRYKHSVRIILLEDLPSGKAYKDEVITVKAGYARNHLIPQKIALYATPQNFDRLNMIDPETEKEKVTAKTSAADDDDLKAADFLKNYLRNKILKIWRVVDPMDPVTTFPGMVDARAVRKKLSKQLLIDLERHEHVHVVSEPIISHEETTDEQIENMVLQDNIDPSKRCEVEIRKLGSYVARITLAGGHAVPLRFVVEKR